MTAFGDAPALPGWVRLLLASVAIVHCLLCLRVILMRAWRRGAHVEAPHAERTPTAAMVAYGVITGHIAFVILRRLPDSPPLVWESIIAYSVALLAGSIAFTQIVVLIRRDKRTTNRLPH